MMVFYERAAVVKVFCSIFAHLLFNGATYFSLKTSFVEIVFKTSCLLKEGFIINFSPIHIVLPRRVHRKLFYVKFKAKNWK